MYVLHKFAYVFDVGQMKFVICFPAVIQLSIQTSVPVKPSIDLPPPTSPPPDNDGQDSSIAVRPPAIPDHGGRPPKPTTVIFNEVIHGLKEIVKDDHHLQEIAIAGMQSVTNKLKVHVSAANGIGHIIEAFKRPCHITSKRRPGVVDMFHGALRGNKTFLKQPKKKGAKRISAITVNVSIPTLC